ncbi:MAG: prolyl oligopeptidase family serine peptidase [Verrucomicrobiota bacterium]
MKILFRIGLIMALFAVDLSAKIPVEKLFKKPDFSGFQLSPDGQYMAFLAPYERRMNLHVIELDSMKTTRVTNIKKNDIEGFQWVNDKRLFFQMDNNGDEWFGLFAVDRDGKNPVTIVEQLSSRDSNFALPRATFVIDRLEDQEDIVLVANNDRVAEYPDVYEMNVKNGRRKMILINPGNVVGWMTDNDGVVRAGVTRDLSKSDSVSFGMVYRKDDDEDFRVIEEFSEENPRVTFAGFHPDNQLMYVLMGKDGGPNALYNYDPATSTLGEKLLSDELFDVSGVGFNAVTDELMVASIDKDKPEFIWYEEEKAQIQEALDQANPDTINLLSSMSDDGTRIIAASYAGNKPTTYNLLKLDNGGLSMVPLGSSASWINPGEMAPQEPFTFAARDGLELRGYLYFPAGKERKNLPLIVNPHGGPNARDSYGWDPRVQFFTSRGFMVLQINFRGSSGRGLEFIKAGHKKWGDEMQWDVYDAVQWAIEQGYVDPKKIGIYGGSYGGYAVMSQLVQYPNLYNFGINVVGVVDLEEMLRKEKEISDFGFAFWQSRIGNLKEDIERIDRYSPTTHIEKLDDPVFIIHGVKDRRVPIKQAEILRSEMRKHDKEFKWLVKANEGHGFQKEENLFLEFNEIEDFIEPFMKKWGMN